MGIRIHKCLGYGISSESFDREQFYEKLDNHKSVEEIIKNAIINKTVDDPWSMLSFHLPGKYNKNYPSSLLDIVLYALHPDIDGGNYIFIPPNDYSTWYRYDNDIDYQEEYIKNLMNNKDGELINHCNEIDVPLYPYINWMDKNTGVIDRKYNRIIDGEKDEIVPFVPEAIQVICKEVDIDWKLLRPMLAVWWS